MRIQKRLAMMLFTICLMFALGVPAYAREVPDTAKTGSVSVTMEYEGKAVPSGALTMYQVGEIKKDDGSYVFTAAGAFQESGTDLSDPSSPELAKRLAAFASDRNLPGREIEIGRDGTAFAGNLSAGLYLIVQTEAADGYEAVSPFLVSIPMNEDGVYLYDVDATPKLDTLTQAEPEPENPGKPAKPSSPRLPQTGQLNWPVPVMAVLGMCLLLAGFALRFGKKGTAYER